MLVASPNESSDNSPVSYTHLDVYKRQVIRRWLGCFCGGTDLEAAARHSRRLVGHHQDRFDRLLVAQGLTETMRLLTHDSMVARYGAVLVCV